MLSNTDRDKPGLECHCVSLKTLLCVSLLVLFLPWCLWHCGLLSAPLRFGGQGEVQICRLGGGCSALARARALSGGGWVESFWLRFRLSDRGRSHAGAWTVVVLRCGLWGSAAGSCGVVERVVAVLLHSFAVGDVVETVTDVRDDSI